MELRELAREDAAAFNAMVNSVCRERRFLIRLEGFSLAETAGFIERLLDGAWPHVVLETSGRLAGWCVVMPRAPEGFRHTGLLGMGLLPPWRGRGLGRRLLDEGLARAWASGLERVELEVYAGNAPAVQLYERAGFVREGRKRRARKLDGVYEDILLMARFAGTEAESVTEIT